MAKKAKEEPKKTVVFIVEGNSDKKHWRKYFKKYTTIKISFLNLWVEILQVMKMSISRM